MNLNIFVQAFVCLFSSSLLATVIDGVEPELNFDPHIYHDHSFKSDSKYLKFVEEKTWFPSKTKLGKKQKAKFEKALDILEEVMNSDEFRRRVIAYRRVVGQDSNGDNIYSNSYQKSYIWNRSKESMSNEEIYDLIMNGDEKMRPGTEGEMNFNSTVKICKWYQKPGVWCRKVIGSTSPSSSKMITLNWKFYKNYEVPQMVSNMVHEWLHLLGFLHGKVNMRQEVPYVVGGIAGQVAKEILDREK
jgi:hypothetical protein